MSHMPNGALYTQLFTSITPSALASGTTANYAPVDVASGDSFQRHDLIRQATNAAGSTLSGLTAGQSGQFVIIENFGPGTLTLTDESSSASTASHRFTLPDGVDLTLPVGGSTMLIYDGATSRWRAGSGSGGGGSVSTQLLNISPLANQYDEAANEDPAEIDDWSDPAIATNTAIVWKGADWPATRFTGIDATGVVAGDVRIFLNLSVSGIDCGQVVLKHDHSGSSQNNRILCPGCKDFYIPVYGAVVMVYQAAIPGVTGSRWCVVDSKGWAGSSVMQSLNIYPSLLTDAVSGQLNDWNPTGVRLEEFIDADEGIAGGSNVLQDYSLIKVVTSAPVDLTGIGGVNGSNNIPTDWGPVKILINYGPHPITLHHQHAGSLEYHRLSLPQSRPLTLRQYESVMLVSPMQDSTGYDTGWRVISLGQSMLTDRSEVTLSAGLTSDLGELGDVVELEGTAPASWIDGMVPLRTAAAGLSSNEIRLLKNVGDVPIYIINRTDSESATENQFRLPEGNGATTEAPPMAIPPGSSMAFQYTEHSGDFSWYPLGAQPVQPTVNTGMSVTADVMAASAKTNDYAPVDFNTGLSGRWAHVWIIQGAFGTVLTGIDSTPGRAFLDVLVPSTNCNTVVQEATPGTAGNSTTLRFVADGTGAGTLDESGYPAIVYHYQNGVTTVTNFETKVAASTHLRIKSGGTGANVLAAPGDTFGPTSLAGGSSLPPFRYGDRVLLLNFLAGLTVNHQDAASLAANRLSIPQATLVLGQWGSMEFMWVGSWIMVGGKPA